MADFSQRSRRVVGAVAALFMAVGGWALVGLDTARPDPASAADPTDPGAISVRMGSATVFEGNGTKPNTLSLDIRYSGSRSQPSCVWWHTAPWSWSASGAQAASGAIKQTLFDGTQDYMTLGSPTPRVTKIAAGAANGRLAVRVFSDSALESDEAFVVEIDKVTSPVSGACTVSAPADPVFGVVQRRGVVTIRDDDTLQPSTVAISLGASATGAVAMDSGLWVVAGTSLFEVDPATNTVVRSSDLGVPLTGITAGAGSLWIAAGGLPDYGEVGEVLRVDPADLSVIAAIPVTNDVQWGAPTAITFAGSKVYFAEGGSMQVTVRTVDPATNAVGPSTPATFPGSSDFYEAIFFDVIRWLYAAGDNIVIANTSTAWLINTSTGLPTPIGRFCDDRASGYGSSGAIASFTIDPMRLQMYAGCPSTGFSTPNRTVGGYIARSAAPGAWASYWSAWGPGGDRITVDTTLFPAGTAFLLGVLNDEIWSLGDASTIVRMQPPRTGYSGEYVGATTTVIPLSAPATDVWLAFGSAWAATGTSITRVIT